MSNILRNPGSGQDVLAFVCANLKRLRTQAGISQAVLAEKSGISRRMIVGLEAGNANISLASLDKLAWALGVDFADIVSDPARQRQRIEALAWRGEKPDSQAVLLGVTPARSEAQLWVMSLGVGDSYTAEPDPQGWHEMIYVMEGGLRLELSGKVQIVNASDFVIYSSAQQYSYANAGETIVRFIRNVIS